LSRAPAASGRKTLKALAYFADRRVVVMLALGFSAGLPNLLIFDTLSAWLHEAGLSLQVIAFFSLATLAYSFKFLWAPLVDRTRVIWLTRRLGHRRSWMLVAQGAIILGLWLVAGSNPAANLGLVAVFAVLTGFASATQDIVIDAWRIEAAEQERQGAMAAAYQWGYRIAMVVAGAAPLVIAEYYGWALSYTVMAVLMGIGVVAVLLAPSERAHSLRPIPTAGIARRADRETVEWLLRLCVLLLGALFLGSGLSGNADLLAKVSSPLLGSGTAEAIKAAWTAQPDGVWLQLVGVIAGFILVGVAALPVPRVKTMPGVYLSHALGDPLANFFGRFGRTGALILALICLYRVSEFVLNIMNPFYLDLGFSKIEIAEVRKVFGVAASMFGVFAGGFAVAKWGLIRPLIFGAFAQPITNLAFAWLATQGPKIYALFIAIGLDNVASAFAGTCLIAYMSSLTAEGFTATQYALFSSLYSLPGKLIASQSGRIVETAARSAENGGLFAPLKHLFVGLPPQVYGESASKLAIAPAALGTGYLAFFLYSILIGIAGIVLAVLISARQAEKSPAGEALADRETSRAP
jgi:PAT family beta-lactamase induction signal transducer AmpG